MTRVIFEMEDGESLMCNICGNLFHGDCYLDIDDEAGAVEGVVCIPCSLRSSNTKVNDE